MHSVAQNYMVDKKENVLYSKHELENCCTMRENCTGTCKEVKRNTEKEVTGQL